MRIAIVEDNRSDRKHLLKLLNLQLNRLSWHVSVSEFDSGGAFLSEAQRKRFDLVFLDIYMENENGIDTAEKLRRMDRDCLLVFTTASRDHALDGFRVRALHYLVKPCSKEELTVLFDEIGKRLPVQDPYMEIKTTDGMTRLRLCEILYAEHYRHQIHIYTADGRRLITRRTFREFSGTLTDERFFLCSRGVIVNLEHTLDFDGADFILKNGQRLPVSRSLSKAARLAFGDFLFRKGANL